MDGVRWAHTEVALIADGFSFSLAHRGTRMNIRTEAKGKAKKENAPKPEAEGTA